MSDEFYRQRAARRTRRMVLAGGVTGLFLLAALGVRALYHDSCTQSFDRAPTSVARSYLDAIRRGNPFAAQHCWQHEAYYDLDAGCSEICLAKVVGAPFRVDEVVEGEPTLTPEGRANLPVRVSVTCDDGTPHTGELILDGLAADVPWKHWAIVHSTVGGTVAQPWCR